ncbi:hypothetical protein VNI00_007099 [Paramarasmius palmivorus]|uniref:Uncharacterized protein n=1 Tax=Paramarasmius palmivorus TaxID=297713 RepID=A0AAW0D5K5_9AGAR
MHLALSVYQPRLITTTSVASYCGHPPDGINVIWPDGTSIAGFVIEGLSILAVLEDDEDLQKLQTTSPPSLEVLPDVVARDIEFVRGLAVAYRNATFLPLDVRDAIKAFLGVQYNAVRNFAHIGDNLYDGSWQDPSFRTYSPSFDIVNQSFAAQVLTDGIDIFDELPPPTRVVPVATLAGSIVGGVLFLAILIALAAFFYRRRQSAQLQPTITRTDSPSLFFSSSAIFVGHNVEVTPFEWDPEWYRERPIQNTKKWPLSTVDQNLNGEPVPDQVAPSPGEPPVVSTPPVDDDSDSPPEYRSR